MPPGWDKTARDETTTSFSLKRKHFEIYMKDPEAKRKLMKGIQGILDLVAANQAVLCPKAEKQDANDVMTVLKVMNKEDVVEDPPEAAEKPVDKQDTREHAAGDPVTKTPKEIPSPRKVPKRRRRRCQDRNCVLLVITQMQS